MTKKKRPVGRPVEWGQPPRKLNDWPYMQEQAKREPKP
jgi:hypothetical protein